MIRRLFSLLLTLVVVGAVVATAPSAYATSGDFNPDTGETVSTVSLVPSLCSSSYRRSSSPSPSTVIDLNPSATVATNYYQFYRPTSLDDAPAAPFCAYTTYRCNFDQPGHVSKVHLKLSQVGSSSSYMQIKALVRAYLTSGGFVDVSGSSNSVSDAFDLTFPSYEGDVSYVLICAVGSLQSSGTSSCIALGRSSTVTLSQFEEVGLLRSIIEWLKGIRDGIVNGVSSIISSLASGFSSVVSGLTNIVNTLIELPGKLIELFITAMRNLFIPSEDDLSAIHSRFETVMSQKLGMLWELSDFFVSTLQGISGASQQSTITFPGLSLPLAGAVFTLPSYEVEIFPSAFSALQEPCKIMVTSVFFGAWIIGVQKFASKFLGEEEEP